ncbi:MAG: hypothetical protein DWQ36_24600 [Acidobacteria bacterium]|mgnify:CR=1 FL=1|nr:MAG: hypothetical protein DWQ30_16910 [Acidobacteriota bacterium]REJ99639.1 MAG: hypothetical protein DWQ36_24600 [Acidobacteriota bacterium]
MPDPTDKRRPKPPSRDPGQGALRTVAAVLAVSIAGSLLASGVASGQSLVTLRDIEKRLLEAKLSEFRAAHEAEISATREATAATQELRQALGNLEIPVERLRGLESELAIARSVADRRQNEAARLRHEIYDRMERLGEIEAALDEAVVDEWGTWTIDFGPDEGPGRVTLRSEAGRIEGQYTMQSGRRGVLRGSFSGNRLQLERIDAQRGRDRTLEGTLSADRSSLRGTWVATELGSGEQTSGVWRAVRIEP